MLTLVAALLSLGLQAAPAVSLPATPQGRQLDAFVTTFRTSETAFVAFQAENMLPKRTPEQHKTMYARMRKDFGDFTILRVLSASADQISVAVKHPAGMNAVFSFAFEQAAPYRITDMNVEVNQQ
ncbi:MAG: hypothetical protein AB7P34_01460 [Vicinamibacterales bacterium]